MMIAMWNSMWVDKDNWKGKRSLIDWQDKDIDYPCFSHKKRTKEQEEENKREKEKIDQMKQNEEWRSPGVTHQTGWVKNKCQENRYSYV